MQCADWLSDLIDAMRCADVLRAAGRVGGGVGCHAME
jgi:hypothetical protein